WPAAPLLAPSPSTCPNGSPYNLLLKIALQNSVMFGCDVKNGRQEIDSRLPTKLSCCLESGGLSFAFQRLFAANPDLDLLRFGFCLLGHRDLQYALVIVCLYRLRINRGRQRERTYEAAITALYAMEVLLFLFLFQLPLAANGQRVVLQADINVLLFNARDFQLERQVVLIFVNVHRRCKRRGGQVLFATGIRILKQPIHA